MVQEAAPHQPPGGCELQRAEVHTSCEAASKSQARHERAERLTREARRDVVAARHRLEQAQMSADPQRRSDEKAAAYETYLSARAAATDDGARAAATASWARAVDRANRSSTLARRTLSRATSELAAAEENSKAREREEHETRMAAEAEEAACLAARVRLAACEEDAQAATRLAAAAATAARAVVPDIDSTADGFESSGHAVIEQPGSDGAAHADRELPPIGAPHPATEHATMRAVTFGAPLVIEGLLRGDRVLGERVAERIAELSGFVLAQVMVQLQEFVDAVISAASQHGFLVFDEQHRFWSHLSSDEAGDVVAALGRLGFMLEPSEGWHAGRVPGSMDLSMALAYAGLDARTIRDLPDGAELADLPRSIVVDAQAFLAEQAPDLSLDHVVVSLGHRAEALGPLWDEWGQIRPMLLSEQRELMSATT